jgi:hypothetical protein
MSSRNKPKTRTRASFDFAVALCSMQNALWGFIKSVAYEEVDKITRKLLSALSK